MTEDMAYAEDAGSGDWVHIDIRVPFSQADDADQGRIFGFLSELGFREVDWCVMEKRDGTPGVVHYSPCEPVIGKWHDG